MSEPAPRRRPHAISLRRRLLLFLLVPMLVLLLLDAMLTYGVALTYSNRVHDKDLGDDVLTLAQMLMRKGLDGDLTPQARFLLEYAPEGHNYFSIASRRRGLLGSNGDFPHIAPPPVEQPPTLYDSALGRHTLRAAAYSMRALDDPSDIITVTIAETLQDRRQRARDILLLAIPLQSLLIVSALSLVWFGVSHGLRVLQPLIRRLAEREHELEPITGADVPDEILPLTRTIDALFARLREAMGVQERFLADAAHQLRTPLTGLRLHVERAMADTRQETVQDALEHIRLLSRRAARTSAQLLSMTRAQSPLSAPNEHAPVDLARVVPDAVALRVPEALHAGLDLGYQGPAGPVTIQGNAAALQELIDNLIDNAMRYAGQGRSATVCLAARAGGGAELAVEDDGPGVPPELMPRLGERFFRAPGTGEVGTGLGLAIVGQIATQHGATVDFAPGAQGGLRVAVRFPPPARPA